MTKEEFILTRLRDERKMYRALFIVLLAALVGSAILLVAMLLARDFGPTLMVFSLGLGFLVSSQAYKGAGDSIDVAVKEIEANPDALAEPWTYSPATSKAIMRVQMTRKDYLGQAIAYLAIGLMLIGAGIVCIWVMGEEDAIGFGLLGGATLVGALLLCTLSFKMFRNWKFLTDYMKSHGLTEEEPANEAPPVSSPEQQAPSDSEPPDTN